MYDRTKILSNFYYVNFILTMKPLIKACIFSFIGRGPYHPKLDFG